MLRALRGGDLPPSPPVAMVPPLPEKPTPPGGGPLLKDEACALGGERLPSPVLLVLLPMPWAKASDIALDNDLGGLVTPLAPAPSA